MLQLWFMIDEAIKALKNKKMILIHDFNDRENETDMVIASEFVTPEIIRTMRKDGGGLICTTIREKDAKKFNLPYLDDLFYRSLDMDKSVLNSSDMGYDTKDAFSLTVNSRDTYTGIPDNDRYKTVKHFSEFINSLGNNANENEKNFGKIFRVPGHIHLLIARNNYFKERKGHTELSTYIVEKAGLIPSATIVETLSDSFNSMTLEESKKYADEHNIVLINGKEIIDDFNKTDRILQ